MSRKSLIKHLKSEGCTPARQSDVLRFAEQVAEASDMPISGRKLREVAGVMYERVLLRSQLSNEPRKLKISYRSMQELLSMNMTETPPESGLNASERF